MASSPMHAGSHKVLAWRDTILAQVLPALFAVLLFLFTYDLSYNRLGSSNGKFISFIDTSLNVFNYRNGCTNRDRSHVGVRQALQILVSSFVIKFASGVVVSVLLGKVPVVFQGWRHSASFFIGLALLWATPGDFTFTYMEKSRAVRVFLGMGGGLYKMRKAIFAVEAANQGGGGVGFALLVAVLAIDGNTLARRAVLWLETHLRRPVRGLRRSGRSIAGDMTFLSMLTHDTSRGVSQTVLGSIVPLGFVTASIWVASRKTAAIGGDQDSLNLQYVDPAWAGGITDEGFLLCRAALLAIFIWRAGTFHELEKIHHESLRFEDLLTKVNRMD